MTMFLPSQILLMFNVWYNKATHFLVCRSLFFLWCTWDWRQWWKHRLHLGNILPSELLIWIRPAENKQMTIIMSKRENQRKFYFLRRETWASKTLFYQITNSLSYFAWISNFHFIEDAYNLIEFQFVGR